MPDDRNTLDPLAGFASVQTRGIPCTVGGGFGSTLSPDARSLSILFDELKCDAQQMPGVRTTCFHAPLARLGDAAVSATVELRYTITKSAASRGLLGAWAAGVGQVVHFNEGDEADAKADAVTLRVPSIRATPGSQGGVAGGTASLVIMIVLLAEALAPEARLDLRVDSVDVGIDDPKAGN